jgi:hypothetical protein
MCATIRKPALTIKIHAGMVKKEVCPLPEWGLFYFKTTIMKHLIKHLWENNFDEIVNKSIKNCHVNGLHSIMLLESPGKTIRLYYHSPKGALTFNNLGVILDLDDQFQMQLAAHPHHCNLTLHCVWGKMVNINLDIVTGSKNYDVKMDRFTYDSKIINEEVTRMFTHSGTDELQIANVTTLNPGQAIFLKADTIHTVYCPGEAAWLVYEGTENPEYKPFAWSNSDLSAVDVDGYERLSVNEITEILTHINLL